MPLGPLRVQAIAAVRTPGGQAVDDAQRVERLVVASGRAGIHSRLAGQVRLRHDAGRVESAALEVGGEPFGILAPSRRRGEPVQVAVGDLIAVGPEPAPPQAIRRNGQSLGKPALGAVSTSFVRVISASFVGVVTTRFVSPTALFGFSEQKPSL